MKKGIARNSTRMLPREPRLAPSGGNPGSFGADSSTPSKMQFNSKVGKDPSPHRGDKYGGAFDSIPIHQSEASIAGLTGSPPFGIVRQQNLDKLRGDMKVRCL